MPAHGPQAILHATAGRPGSALARWHEATSEPYGLLRPLVGPFLRPIVRVSGTNALIAQAADSLPEGAARPEAIAVRLRRAGVPLAWGPAEELPDTASFIRLCHARGASSVELARSDQSLVTELQLGAFFHAFWWRRVVRRTMCRFELVKALLGRSGALIGIASDVAFWLGVRSAATNREWERLTRSSYVVFYFHGVKEHACPEEEHLHIHPSRFDRHLRWLRRLGFRALSSEELLSFHLDPEATLPARSYVIAADDGFRNVVKAFGRHAHLHPQVFVNTAAVGGAAIWAYDEPLATWRELEEFEAAGGVVASHGRSHAVLPDLDAEALADELDGALADLQSELQRVPPLLAYPYGAHDERIRSAAAAAGYRAGFTTEPGRNGAGTDPFCLRRLGVLDWDSRSAFLWKALSGELLPWVWESWRRRRRAAESARQSDLERGSVS